MLIIFLENFKSKSPKTSTQGNNNVSDDSHTAKDEALVPEKELPEIKEELKYHPAEK